MYVRNRRRLVLASSSIPSWVRSLGPIYPDYTFNWALGAGGTVYQKVGGITTPTAVGVTTTRASVKQVADVNGNYSQVSSNTTAVGIGVGRSTEEARTNSIHNNSMVGAVAGTPGTLPTNWVRSANDGLSFSIVSIGTESGINYVDIRYFGTSTGALGQNINFEGATGIAALYGQTWTGSLFLRMAAGSTANLTNLILQLNERTNTGATTGTSHSSGNLTGSLGAATLGVAKTSFSSTLTNAAVNFVVPEIVLSYSSGVAIDITLRIGWPQLENNSLINSSVASAVVAAGGTLGTTGTAVYSVGGGTGTPSTLNVTVSGGAISAINSVASAGSYTVLPPSPAALTYVSGTGTGVTGATVTLTPTNNNAAGFATSPIITSGSAVSRASDVTSLPITVGSAYTLFETATPAIPPSNVVRQYLSTLTDAPQNNAVYIDRSGGTGFPSLNTLIANIGSGNPAIVSSAHAQGVAGVYAASFSSVGVNGVFNNGTVTNFGVTIPSVPIVTWWFGSFGSSQQLNGTTSKDAIWLTQAIPNAQLQALS